MADPSDDSALRPANVDAALVWLQRGLDELEAAGRRSAAQGGETVPPAPSAGSAKVEPGVSESMPATNRG